MINISKNSKDFIFADIFISKAPNFLPFLSFTMDNIKNVKISESSHRLLKEYCKKNGLKIHKYLELLIEKNCKEKKYIYGEN